MTELQLPKNAHHTSAILMIADFSKRSPSISPHKKVHYVKYVGYIHLYVHTHRMVEGLENRNSQQSVIIAAVVLAISLKQTGNGRSVQLK